MARYVAALNSHGGGARAVEAARVAAQAATELDGLGISAEVASADRTSAVFA